MKREFSGKFVPLALQNKQKRPVIDLISQSVKRQQFERFMCFTHLTVGMLFIVQQFPVSFGWQEFLYSLFRKTAMLQWETNDSNEIQINNVCWMRHFTRYLVSRYDCSLMQVHICRKRENQSNHFKPLLFIVAYITFQQDHNRTRSTEICCFCVHCVFALVKMLNKDIIDCLFHIYNMNYSLSFN